MSGEHLGLEDEVVVLRLREMLKEVDLDTCTERQLRERLEKEFQLSLKDKKELVRKEIEDFLLIKSAEDEIKEVTKNTKKRGKARPLSPEMQEFMGVESSSWQEVTAAVWKYIRKFDLQSADDRHNIQLDDTLSKLFSEPLSMFNLSKQLGRHLEEDVPQTQPKKAKGKGAKRSGFMRPLRLSVQLRELLGIRDNENVARGELSKKFWDYFRHNDLQDPSDRRWILADDNLKTLLGTERFQAFSIQKLCKHHILGYLDDAPEKQSATPPSQSHQSQANNEDTPSLTPKDIPESVENGNETEMVATNDHNSKIQNEDQSDQIDQSNFENETNQQKILEFEQVPDQIIPETQQNQSEQNEPNQGQIQGQNLSGEKQAEEEAQEEAIDQSLFPSEDGGEGGEQVMMENNGEGGEGAGQDIYEELLQQMDQENVPES